MSTEELEALLPEVDVVVLTTTEVERQALHEVMKPLPGRTGLVEGAIKHVTYRLGQLGRYFVAHAESTMGSQARHASTLTVHDAIAELAPKAVIVIGIAFGLKPMKQQLGDVIVAELVTPYELQRVNKDSKPTPRGQPIPCGTILSERFRARSADWKLMRGADTVKVFQGELLSGEKLADNLAFRDALVQAFPNALGGEMEGMGAYAATIREKVEVILVKAICDWGDGSKTDQAQPFAAKAAVSLVHHILSKRDVLAPLRARDRNLSEEHQPPTLVTASPTSGEQSFAPTDSAIPLAPTTVQSPEDAASSTNPKRSPLPMFLAESGIREVSTSIALVGCSMIQHPEKLARQVEQLQENLLHDRHLPQEEKQRLKRQGFMPGADHSTTRTRLLELLTVADIDIFVFYVKKASRSGGEEELRTELFTRLLRDRLPSRKWPAATICGRFERLPSLLRAAEDSLQSKGWPNVHIPALLTPKARDPRLLVAQYACDIVRARLEQLMAAPALPSQPADVDRIRTKLRMVENIETGERFYRKRPLP